SFSRSYVRNARRFKGIEMKILIVGAGAVGALFGASLHEHGSDVQFLLRPARKQLVDENGITLELPGGQINVRPRTLLNTQLDAEFDLIILTNKAYSLESV